MKITTSSSVRATPFQVSCEVNGEAVILNTQTNMYFGLDPVGARIWELLRVPRRLGDVCNAIGEEYEVDPETCAQDVCDIIAQMAEAGLVEVEE